MLSKAVNIIDENRWNFEIADYVRNGEMEFYIEYN